MEAPAAVVSMSGAMAKKVDELLQEEKNFKNNSKGGRAAKKQVNESEDEEIEEDEAPPKTKGKSKQPVPKTGTSKDKPLAKQKPATKEKTPAESPTKTPAKQAKISGFLRSGRGSPINTKANKRKSPDDEDSDDESDISPAKKTTGGKKVAFTHQAKE